MPAELNSSTLIVLALGLGALGALAVLASLIALARFRLLSFTVQVLLGLLLLTTGALAGMIGLGIQGYRALTREDVVAHLLVRPAGEQRFLVTVRYPDGRESPFDVAGDEVYVDAHILKWKPVA